MNRLEMHLARALTQNKLVNDALTNNAEYSMLNAECSMPYF